MMLLIRIGICCGLLWVYFLNNNDLLAFSHNTVTHVRDEVITGILCGNVCSVTGTARIIKKSADLKNVGPGDIIVTVMTQDSWLPHMKNISGIITNVGDSSCHAALFGKKHSIPVIVGAGNATEKIGDGHCITIDCSHGSAVGKVYKQEKEHFSAFITSRHVKSSVISHTSAVGTGHTLPTDKTSTFDCAQKITVDTFYKHQRSFIDYVLGIQKQVSWRTWIGETKMIKLARTIGGCGDFEVKCMPLAYDFFDQDKNYIESIIKKIEMDYINMLFELYHQKPGDKEWLARVLHTEHVKKITLPDDVDRQALMSDPGQYKKIIDQKKINTRERDTLIASGLFVRYWVENKCRA